jgi:lipopolysaccharide assembly outer membrane protein LptD (OstA)
MSDLFKDIIPSIQQNKKVVITQENERDYVPFVVNRSLSFHHDIVMFANEMNKHPSIDPLLQYHYLLNTVRGYKRPFQKWQKREIVEDLEAVKEYFGYSNEKAKEAISLLSDKQIEQIKKTLNKGGLNVRHKRISGGNTTKS